jgi:hypothetical protein
VSKLRVQCFAISVDGHGAGANQGLENPLGVRGPELMEWFFHTRVWRQMHGPGRRRGRRRQRDGRAGLRRPRCLDPRLIDELHLAIRPVLLGAGEKFWDGIDLSALGYEVARHVAGERAMHVFLKKRG